MPQRSRLLGTALLIAVCSVPIRAQVREGLRPAAEFVSALEAASRSPAAAQRFEEQFGPGLELATIDGYVAKVREYIAQAPDDTEALILAVRLGRIRDGFAWQEGMMEAFSSDSAQEDLLEPPAVDQYLSLLDRALARDSNSAAGHHWKARLLVEGPLLELGAVGGWIPWPTRSGGPVDWNPAEALDHARRAVEIAPADPLYREFLAVELVLAGQVGEAAEVMRRGSDPDDPLRLIIEDLEALGIPPGATVDWGLQGLLLRFAMMGAADSEDLSFIDHAEVRYRAWTVPMSLEELEAFYQARWPGMRFFAADGWEGAYAAALVATPDGWTPVVDSAALEDGSLDDADGLSLIVLPAEVLAELTQGMLGQGGAADGADQHVGILLMNLRRGPWATDETDDADSESASGW